MENMEEMDKFLEKYNFPKLNQEETENLSLFADDMILYIKNPKPEHEKPAAQARLNALQK